MTPDATSAAAASLPRPRYAFLDGLRGLAALYVVLHHAYMEAVFGAPLRRVLGHATNWLQYGQVAVDVFIVLSGFCLMLPLARNANATLRLAEFTRRRAQRILPPYYAALLLSLAVLAAVPGLRTPAGVRWDVALPAFNPASLAAHAALIQNLSTGWGYKIDYPMWSVATEWQIYFVFALALLPLFRRSKTACAVIAFLVGGVLDHFFRLACFHFLGLFALGMAAASHSQTAPRSRYWAWVSAGLVFVFWLATEAAARFLWTHIIVMDAMIGAATAALILHCAAPAEHSAGPSLAVRVLQSRGAVWLGVFSYSLYLVHAPVLAAAHLLLRRMHAGQMLSLGVLVIAGVPLAIAVSYAFHIVFERPFLARRERPAATVAVAQ